MILHMGYRNFSKGSGPETTRYPLCETNYFEESALTRNWENVTCKHCLALKDAFEKPRKLIKERSKINRSLG